MDKPIYKSKTIWAAGLAIMLVAYQMVTAGEVNPDMIYKVLLAAGFVGARDAIGNMKK